ncbi:FAD-binding protein [Actinoplanes sp. NPDC026619]|uniref:FAD-binding protein n=1 Tax=Actinoplanes sp. NPDC026619 TaxID=3155798 RepID=UPI0034074114
MSPNDDHVDVAIVGAGPAGLAAAHALTGTGLRTVLLDAGKPVWSRDRHVGTDVTRGIGGAGLFSDGKFSFYPSASQLWSLSDGDRLRAAYDWTSGVLREAGLDAAPFPESPEAYTAAAGEWVLKAYPSDYLSLDARLALTQRLVDAVDAEVRTETELVHAAYAAGSDVFNLDVRGPGGDGALSARRLVLATGRFGPLRLSELIGERVWRRLEVGFRIEQPAGLAFFADSDQLDPKLRFGDADGSVEWRTFCACRQGEAVMTETDGLWTVSGRADCPPTGRSNIGFNTRVLDEALAVRSLPHLLKALADDANRFDEPLLGLLDGVPSTQAVLDRVYGEELCALMRRGVQHLVRRYPGVLDERTRMVGPTLEGVGWYPTVDGRLRLRDAPAVIAGDGCGLFRGIVAAMVSGHYAASGLATEVPAR